MGANICYDNEMINIERIVSLNPTLECFGLHVGKCLNKGTKLYIYIYI